MSAPEWEFFAWKRACHDAVESHRITRTDFTVAMALQEHADYGRPTGARPGMERLRSRAGLGSSSNVKASLGRLRAAGLVVRLSHGGGYGEHARGSLYLLTMPDSGDADEDTYSADTAAELAGGSGSTVRNSGAPAAQLPAGDADPEGNSAYIRSELPAGDSNSAHNSAYNSAHIWPPTEITERTKNTPPLSPQPTGPETNGSHPERQREGFEEFWTLYPKKSGRDLAEKAWIEATSHTPAQVILAGLRKCPPGLHASAPRFIRSAATWLAERRWTDEPPIGEIEHQLTNITARGHLDIFKNGELP